MDDIGSLLLQILVVALIVGVAFASIVLARNLDRDRIRQYIEKAGGKVVDINRKPFGPGWFGSRERIYEVKYETRHGKVHTGTCKTSMFAGVYWAGHAPGLTYIDESPAHLRSRLRACPVERKFLPAKRIVPSAGGVTKERNFGQDARFFFSTTRTCGKIGDSLVPFWGWTSSGVSAREIGEVAR